MGSLAGAVGGVYQNEKAPREAGPVVFRTGKRDTASSKCPMGML
jgi:hypothetical protein